METRAAGQWLPLSWFVKDEVAPITFEAADALLAEREPTPELARALREHIETERTKGVSMEAATVSFVKLNERMIRKLPIRL